MEPKSSEHMPTPVEFTPAPSRLEMPPQDVERESTPERGQELQQQSMPVSPVPTPIQLPTPVLPGQVSDDQQVTTPVDDDAPGVAGDEDLIEKEWVDKAKKIIQDTKNDPHAREQRVGKLQADYLKKRYGKELGGQT